MFCIKQTNNNQIKNKQTRKQNRTAKEGTLTIAPNILKTQHNKSQKPLIYLPTTMQKANKKTTKQQNNKTSKKKNQKEINSNKTFKHENENEINQSNTVMLKKTKQNKQ